VSTVSVSSDVDESLDIRASDRPDAPGPRAEQPPAWLRLLAFASAAGVCTFGGTGLLLAINGWYQPALAIGIGAVLWIALLVLGKPAYSNGSGAAPSARSAHIAAAVGLIAILGVTGWNEAHASQHVLINRDGGAYANSGRWIARDGSLVVKPRVGPFANDPSLQFDSFAVYSVPDGTLQFQFAHLLPALLAEAHAVGGDRALFHLPELLGGIALLAFFVLAWRLLRRPAFAVAATLAFAFIIPQVSFSRDSYSEIPVQIALFTVAWLLIERRLLLSWRVAGCAGLLLGVTEAIRVDGVAFLIGVPLIFAVAYLSAAREQRRQVLLAVGAFIVGVVPGLALGLVDLMRHSGGYYADLSKNVHTLSKGAVVSAVGAVVLVVVWRWIAPILRHVPRAGFATVAAVVVGVGGFAVWILRPRFHHAHGLFVGLVAGLQNAEHVAVDGTRNYSEYSLTWMRWYLGPLTLAAAIVGSALLVRALITGRYLRAIPAVALLVPESLLYLFRVRAVPDHVWVDRRFLSSAFPALILLAFGLAAFLWGSGLRSRMGTVARAIAVLVAVGGVGYPLYTLWDVRAMTEQRPFLLVVHDACAKVGDHAAIVVLERDERDLYDDWLPQTLRGWCGAEVAARRGAADGPALRKLAREWQAAGRTLYVVSVYGDVISRALPDATVEGTRSARNQHLLEQTLTHRPDGYRGQGFSLAVARVPTA
jgi:hypothetical protein